MNVLQYLKSPSRIWAIESGAYDELVEIAKGENLSVETIEASLGTLNNQVTNGVEVIEGVAVIPVIGPIVKYGNLFTKVSGATSVEKLTESFTAAIVSDEVKSILFKIDSPGGEANGINEFSEMIYNARGIKPIESYVSGQGCSAAYWIASAGDKIYQDQTAVTGSIGVAAVVKDDEGVDTAAGIKTYKFVSDGSENKRPDLETEEGKQVVMDNLNAMARVFRSKVARNRSTDELSLTPKDVIEKFNRGGVLMGEAAVKAGLSDGVSSYNEVLLNLINRTTEEDSSKDDEIESQENTMSKENENVGTITAEAFEAVTTELTDLKTLKETLEGEISTLTATLQDAETTLANEAKAKVTLQEENLKLKATAEASNKKIIPAQKATFVANYVQLAKDDIASPVEGSSRLDNFLSMWEASNGGGLLEEELDPENTNELNNDSEQESDGISEVIAAGRAFAQEQNNKMHAAR